MLCITFARFAAEIEKRFLVINRHNIMKKNLKDIDTILSIFQRTIIILGCLFSAWFYFFYESSPHVALTTNSEIIQKDIIRVNVQVKNLGKKPYVIESAGASIFLPDISEKITESSKPVKIGRQISKIQQDLRAGESSSFGLNVKVDIDEPLNLFIIKTLIRIKGEKTWARITEEALVATSSQEQPSP